MISEVDSFKRSPPVDFQQEDTRLPVEYQQQPAGTEEKLEVETANDDYRQFCDNRRVEHKTTSKRDGA
jgi:hypothetical protein